MLKNIEWIFFDLGSTLVDEQMVYARIFQNMADQTGLEKAYLREEAEKLFSIGLKGDVELCRRYNLPKRRWYVEEERLYASAIPCLEVLHGKYKLGIIANQAAGARERMGKWKILQYFDLVIISEEEGISKPDSKIFSLALERAECMPETAVMIGDRIDNDILPAKRAGMQAIWVRQGFGGCWALSVTPETIDYIVDDLTQICDILT